MTTAHRATWRSARGGDQEEGSFRLHVGTAQVSAKAGPGHRVLKTRDGVLSSDRAALRAALEAGESGALLAIPNAFEKAQSAAVRALDDDLDLDSDGGGGNSGSAPRKRARISADGDEGAAAAAAAANESDESDSDDDDAALLAELENIRAERAAERERRELEEREELERQQDAAAAVTSAANPLLGNLADDDTASIATATTNASFAVKRRWNDDVIFKNQARGERKTEQRFVNDTIRNDFHRRFLKRYIR